MRVSMMRSSTVTIAGHGGIAARFPAHSALALGVKLTRAEHGGRVLVMRDFLAAPVALAPHARHAAAA
jgi:hypothetical protein